MEFEKSLNEAIIGTNKGYVYYINLKDKKSLKLISRMMPTLDMPSICKFDANQKNEIFIVQSSSYSGEFKLYSSKMIDELKRFEQKGCGQVVFIERLKKKYFIGYADGAMKVYDFQNFESKEQYRFDLDHGD